MVVGVSRRARSPRAESSNRCRMGCVGGYRLMPPSPCPAPSPCSLYAAVVRLQGSLAGAIRRRLDIGTQPSDLSYWYSERLHASDEIAARACGVALCGSLSTAARRPFGASRFRSSGCGRTTTLACIVPRALLILWILVPWAQGYGTTIETQSHPRPFWKTMATQHR